jgi:polar amino acid transport system permease protein
VEFDLAYLTKQLPALRAGFVLTIQISAIAVAISVLIGLVGASLRVLRVPVFSQLVVA